MCSMFWYRDLTSYTAKRRLIWFPPQHKNYIRLEPLQTLMIPWNIHIYCKICFHLQQNNFMLSQFYWKKEKNKKDCKCSHMKSCCLGRNRMETSRDVAGSVDVCIIRKWIESFLIQPALHLTQNKSACSEGLGQIIKMQFDLLHTLLCWSPPINKLNKKGCLLPTISIFFH